MLPKVSYSPDNNVRAHTHLKRIHEKDSINSGQILSTYAYVLICMHIPPNQNCGLNNIFSFLLLLQH